MTVGDESEDLLPVREAPYEDDPLTESGDPWLWERHQFWVDDYFSFEDRWLAFRWTMHARHRIYGPVWRQRLVQYGTIAFILGVTFALLAMAMSMDAQAAAAGVAS